MFGNLTIRITKNQCEKQSESGVLNSDFFLHSHSVSHAAIVFDFQHLEVYKKAKAFHLACKHLMKETKSAAYVNDHLGRASFSIALNIAEGSAKFSKADRRNYVVTARGSVFECVAIMDILHDEGLVGDDAFTQKLLIANE